jgi:predicted RNA methylase
MTTRLTRFRIRISDSIKSRWEKANGLDFTSQVYPQHLGLDPDVFYKSSPSGNRYLEAVLNDMLITPADSIIDVGCGKGSAMRTMLKYPFVRVDGVEILEQISAIARLNFARLKENRCTIFTLNAADFAKYDPYNMVYFYNPFPREIMVKVMDYIVESINRAPRRMVIIYDNPNWGMEITRSGDFIKANEYPDEWGNRIFIYTNTM